MAEAKRLSEAQKLVAEGEKCLKTSFFQWSPDNTAAAPCFEKAANIFRSLQKWEDAGDCYSQAAACYVREKIPLPAARQYENAYDQYMKMSNWKLAVFSAETASELYVDTNQEDRIPQCLVKLGTALQHVDGVRAMATYKKALDTFVEMKKTMFAGQTFQVATSFGVAQKLYNETVNFLDSAIIAHTAMKQAHEVARDRLSQILIYLFSGNVKDASELLDDKLDDFVGGDEHLLAARFLDSYETGKVEVFEKLKTDVSYRFLNSEIVNLGNNFHIPQSIIDSMEQKAKMESKKAPIEFNDIAFKEKEVTKTSNYKQSHITEDQMKALNSMTSILSQGMVATGQSVESQNIKDMDEDQMNELL
ncbi:gamma-soluble NSF attachment protein, putative [Entamoeba invadens IP1]|uniref:Gamma-soluble NSF attachment protein n=1 Tax=Entamoeba invadens IP1 TaxID=370355 RepID=A0A0A1TX90_ENTIV|nr:gamma-soluble NSF attachment protein, putative [Entamoeba invadens IP1]ELP85887.1 gamma-soluble NSF attachment protein, putative [Entamoeba invadens IP1]|eukprot:XP_004185233.1 gamma-soluble NSF attachment protein, putative [Entamoeba invadens IP1]